MKEFIVCSVVKYDGHNVCGLRHSDCYETIMKITGKKFEGIKEHVTLNNMDNGFLTSKGRFVTRNEAWIIAESNNQIAIGYEASKSENDKDNILISENLY